MNVVAILYLSILKISTFLNNYVLLNCVLLPCCWYMSWLYVTNRLEHFFCIYSKVFEVTNEKLFFLRLFCWLRLLNTLFDAVKDLLDQSSSKSISKTTKVSKLLTILYCIIIFHYCNWNPIAWMYSVWTRAQESSWASLRAYYFRKILFKKVEIRFLIIINR